MTASLPTLPQLSTGVDLAALSQGDTPLNQQLASAPGEFGPLLQEAVGALGEAPVVAPEGLEPLPHTLQGLPQAGKLLPLLQQVLDAAGAEGMDAQAVLDDISAKLKLLSADQELAPEQAVAAAIQQFIEENPQLTASIASGLLRDLPGYTTRTAADPGTRAHHEASRPLPAAAAAQADSDAGLPETTVHPAQRSPAGQGRPGGEFMGVNPVQQDVSSHEAAALFSRLVSRARSAGVPEALPRNDNLLTTLGALTPTPPAPAAAQPSPALQSISLNVPFNQAGWDKALGERIQWMVGQGVQRASIKLNPANLGPMEVRIQVQNDQASVQFTSAHSVVREALEAALPRLRDMFDSAGVELGEVDVSGQSFAERQQAPTDGQGGTGHRDRNSEFGPEGEAEITLETPVHPLPGNGRLDLFA
jgi:flagellar hook-length control protein FliK